MEMEKVMVIIVVAFLCETLWETVKLVKKGKDGKVDYDRVGAIIVGLVLAIGAGIDIFDYLGIQIVIPFMGSVFTGLLISRGANFTHDIIQTAYHIMNSTKQE